MNQDEQHLRLLSVFHYVMGGLAAIFACFPAIHLLLGLMMILAPERMAGGGQPPPVFMGGLFVLMGALFMLAGWVFAGCLFAVGRCLAQRKAYLFCLVIAAIECFFMPLGTVLGVFTIIVLSRDSVKAQFIPKGSARAF